MYDTATLSRQPARASTSDGCADRVDFIEAGAGSPVVLVHSSMAGARQWSALTRDLQDRYLVRAVNLFGYGNTPAWPEKRSASLDDYAELVAMAAPRGASDITLVGHSFGGAVAMQAAAHQLKGRVKRLVLIEPSPFFVLDHANRRQAYYEISTLAKYTKRCISSEVHHVAAERFIDYWCGLGTWAASPADRKDAFARSISVLSHEWDAVLRSNTAPETWTAALPQDTLVISSANTVRPSREIVDVLSRLRPDWEFASIYDGGHMAPLTHPHIVNPIIKGFLG